MNCDSMCYARRFHEQQRVSAHSPGDAFSNRGSNGPSSTKSGKESDSFHRDLAIAKHVQEASFPQTPAIPGVNCATYYKPAHSVGGDYYDFLPLQNGSWGIAIGDVSGKGIGAALVMANLQGLLRAQSLQRQSDLEMVMTNVNRVVWETSPQHFFASLFYSEYQPQSRVLRYVNAGHNPPLVLRGNQDHCTLFALTSEYMPVGVFKSFRYKSTAFQLEIDDVLVAYTDGLTEWENPHGSPFGDKRLERILYGCGSQDPQNILQLILDDLSVHSARAAQADDIALVVMQVKAHQDDTNKTALERTLC